LVADFLVVSISIRRDWMLEIGTPATLEQAGQEEEQTLEAAAAEAARPLAGLLGN